MERKPPATYSDPNKPEKRSQLTIALFFIIHIPGFKYSMIMPFWNNEYWNITERDNINVITKK